jgi:hypothetical protein
VDNAQFQVLVDAINTNTGCVVICFFVQVALFITVLIKAIVGK